MGTRRAQKGGQGGGGRCKHMRLHIHLVQLKRSATPCGSSGSQGAAVVVPASAPHPVPLDARLGRPDLLSARSLAAHTHPALANGQNAWSLAPPQGGHARPARPHPGAGQGLWIRRHQAKKACDCVRLLAATCASLQPTWANPIDAWASMHTCRAAVIASVQGRPQVAAARQGQPAAQGTRHHPAANLGGVGQAAALCQDTGGP